MYAHQNLTAKEYFNDWDDGGNHTGSVPAVSWWKVGQVIFPLVKVIGILQIKVIGIVKIKVIGIVKRKHLIISRMCWECRSGPLVSLWTHTPWNR